MRTYNLFISHRWGYRGDYERLVRLLDAAPRFSWKNYSVPAEAPFEITSAPKLRRALHRQMRVTHVVLVIAGVYASYSDWMQEELELAESYDKPIVAVAPWRSRKTSVPCRQAAVEMVSWNTKSIVASIRRNSI